MTDASAGLLGLDDRWPRLRAAWRGGDDSPLTAQERTRLVEGIGRISAGLTRERELAGVRYLDDPTLLGAYLLFYWPRSYAQAASILGELPGPLGRTLDLGAGPLPMTWAALDRGATSVRALDRSDQALALGRRIGETSQLVTQSWDAQSGDALPDGPFDTILAGHVLNELFLSSGTRALDRRVALVQALLRRLAPRGRLVIIEPALRETSRALLQLRDRLASEAHIVAPCLMQLACPALGKESDWCHAERAWEPPAELTQLAEVAKLHQERLKMSYLVLANERDVVPVDEALFRIVSSPMPQKGKHVLFGCGPRGRHALVQRDRDADVFVELERGDLARIENVTQRGDGLRIEGPVIRVARAGEPR
ncbi:MAG: small ribosomal subunit Rsm22 family protein [Polyangia bacterium]